MSECGSGGFIWCCKSMGLQWHVSTRCAICAGRECARLQQRIQTAAIPVSAADAKVHVRVDGAAGVAAPAPVGVGAVEAAADAAELTGAGAGTGACTATPAAAPDDGGVALRGGPGGGIFLAAGGGGPGAARSVRNVQVVARLREVLS